MIVLFSGYLSQSLLYAVVSDESVRADISASSVLCCQSSLEALTRPTLPPTHTTTTPTPSQRTTTSQTTDAGDSGGLKLLYIIIIAVVAALVVTVVVAIVIWRLCK
jgi:hypothetical protein